MAFFRNFPKTNYDFLGNGVQTRIIDLFRFVKPNDKFTDELAFYSYYEIQEGDRPDVVSQKLYGTPEYYWTFFIVNEHLRTGLSSWPLSSDEFEKYIAEEYSGTIATCRPKYIYDGDDILRSIEDSLSDRFIIGEQVVGFLSGATATLTAKDPTTQQMTLTNVLGVFQENEIIRGNTSQDFVTTYKVYDRQLAPHHWEDGNGRTVHNALYISGGTPEIQLDLITYREYEQNLNDQRAKIRIVRESRIFEFADAYQDLINR
jgi:hypothetical protein